MGSCSSLLLSQLSTPTPIIGVEYYSLTPRLYYQGLLQVDTDTRHPWGPGALPFPVGELYILSETDGKYLTPTLRVVAR